MKATYSRHELCILRAMGYIYKLTSEAIKAGLARRRAALYSKEVGKMKAYLSNGTMTSLMSPASQ